MLWTSNWSPTCRLIIIHTLPTFIHYPPLTNSLLLPHTSLFPSSPNIPFLLVFCGWGLEDLLCMSGELGASLLEDSGRWRAPDDSPATFCPMFRVCMAVTQREKEGASSAWRRNSAPWAVTIRKTNFFLELDSAVVTLGTTSMAGSSEGLCWIRKIYYNKSSRHWVGGGGVGERERCVCERERKVVAYNKCIFPILVEGKFVTSEDSIVSLPWSIWSSLARLCQVQFLVQKAVDFSLSNEYYITSSQSRMDG